MKKIKREQLFIAAETLCALGLVAFLFTSQWMAAALSVLTFVILNWWHADRYHLERYIYALKQDVENTLYDWGKDLNELENAKSENISLRAKCDDIMGDYEIMSENLASRDKEINSLSEKLTTLKKELSIANGACGGLKTERDRLKKRVYDLSEENANLDAQIKKMNADMEKAAAENEKQQKIYLENSGLFKKRIHELENDYSKCVEEMEDCKRVNSNHEATIADLKKKITSSKVHYTELNEKFNEVCQQRNTLSNRLAEYEEGKPDKELKVKEAIHTQKISLVKDE